MPDQTLPKTYIPARDRYRLRNAWHATRKKWPRLVLIQFIDNEKLSSKELWQKCVKGTHKPISRQADFAKTVLTPMRIAGLIQYEKIGKYWAYCLTKMGAYALMKYGLTNAIPAGDFREVALKVEKERQEQWNWQTKNNAPIIGN